MVWCLECEVQRSDRSSLRVNHVGVSPVSCSGRIRVNIFSFEVAGQHDFNWCSLEVEQARNGH